MLSETCNSGGSGFQDKQNSEQSVKKRTLQDASGMDIVEDATELSAATYFFAPAEYFIYFNFATNCAGGLNTLIRGFSRQADEQSCSLVYDMRLLLLDLRHIQLACTCTKLSRVNAASGALLWLESLSLISWHIQKDIVVCTSGAQLKFGRLPFFVA